MIEHVKAGCGEFRGEEVLQSRCGGSVVERSDAGRISTTVPTHEDIFVSHNVLSRKRHTLQSSEQARFTGLHLE